MKPVTAALACLLTITGCSSTTGTIDTTAPDSRPSSSTSSTVAQASTPRVGATYRWEDGLSVTVTEVKQIRRQSWASGGSLSDDVIRVTVRLTNGTTSRVDPALATIGLRYGADGESAEDVFQDGVGDGFTGTIDR
jgi:hypothetical protein